MRSIVATLEENRSLAPHTFVLRLSGCEELAETAPGQFVMLRGQWGSDPLLPRAFSLLTVLDGGRVDILVKGTGKAASLLEQSLPGARFDVLGPLGTTFPEPSADRVDWYVAGGVGLAPLMMQAELAAERGCANVATMFYGGRSATDLVLLDDIARTGVEIALATEDGSRGRKGYVTDAVSAALDARPADAPLPTLMACGPEPMLEAVAALAHRRGLPAYLSLEGEMACGIGACLACAVPCNSKPFRYTCKEGPVLPLSDLAGPYGPPEGGAS